MLQNKTRDISIDFLLKSLIKLYALQQNMQGKKVFLIVSIIC
jgi:hypothetical protein